MIKRWILYLVALLGCIIFLAAYRGWIAWLLLLTVALLPLLSLVLSLALMLLPKAELCNPGPVTVGDVATLELKLSSLLPLPPYRCDLRVDRSMTGDCLLLEPGDPLPTEHCGQLLCTGRGVFFYDLLGMFRLRRKLPSQTVLIRPKPVAGQPPRELERRLAHSWQPKYGGGFSENHELRLYRPGDGLNQVHWKLSAKTGKLIIREAMVPRPGRILLTVDLAGAPEELDRRLGRLLWMGRQLLELGLRFEIRTLTGDGIRTQKVATEEDLTAAIDMLLCCRPATAGSIRDRYKASRNFNSTLFPARNISAFIINYSVHLKFNSCY